MISNLLIASHLVDVMSLNELETYLHSRISSLSDWKLLAQKCSVKSGKLPNILKSDIRQLLIVCWFVFILILNETILFFIC
jgi:hypothetical protein